MASSTATAESLKHFYADFLSIYKGIKDKDITLESEELSDFNFAQKQQIKALPKKDQEIVLKFSPTDEKEDILHLLCYKEAILNKGLPRYWNSLSQIEVREVLSQYISDKIESSTSENRAKIVSDLQSEINYLTNESECLHKFCKNYKKMNENKISGINNDLLDKEQKTIIAYTKMLGDDKYNDYHTKKVVSVIKIAVGGGLAFLAMSNLNHFGPEISIFADHMATYAKPILDTISNTPLLEQVSNLIPHADTVKNLLEVGGLAAALKTVSFKTVYGLATKFNNNFLELFANSGRPKYRYDNKNDNLDQASDAADCALFTAFREMKNNYMDSQQEKDYIKALTHCHNLVNYDRIKINHTDAESQFFGDEKSLNPDNWEKEVDIPKNMSENGKKKLSGLTRNEALLAARIKHPVLQYAYFFETSNFEDKIKILEISTKFSSVNLKTEILKLDKITDSDYKKMAFELNEVYNKNPHMFSPNEKLNLEDIKKKVSETYQKMTPIEKTLFSYIPNNKKIEALQRYLIETETDKKTPIMSLINYVGDLSSKIHNNELEKGWITKTKDATFGKVLDWASDFAGSMKSFCKDLGQFTFDIATSSLSLSRSPYKGYDFEKSMALLKEESIYSISWEKDDAWIRDMNKAIKEHYKLNSLNRKIQNFRDTKSEFEPQMKIYK